MLSAHSFARQMQYECDGAARTEYKGFQQMIKRCDGDGVPIFLHVLADFGVFTGQSEPKNSCERFVTTATSDWHSASRGYYF